MTVATRSALVAVWTMLVVSVSSARAAPEPDLLPLMADELKLSMDKLVAPDGTKPYFLQYTIIDDETVNISATLGALIRNAANHRRSLDVDARCGDYALDSTRQIRGRGMMGGFEDGPASAELPLDGNPIATRQDLWLATDNAFKDAAKRLAQVKANLKVKVDEEDPSEDFTHEPAVTHTEEWLSQTVDREVLAAKLRKWSQLFRSHPEVFDSDVTLTGTVKNQVMVNSEGSKVQFGRGWWRIGIQASTLADDGMELWQYTAFDGHSPDTLPSDEDVAAAVQQVIEDLQNLRKAPVVDPYTGPAILRNRASGVFFHEIFGHRIEGHRQKDVEEGQTFAKKIGQEVLPPFLSVVDNPPVRTFGSIELNGYYQYDDEAVAAQPVKLVDQGILKTFLLSRTPTRGFTQSNGHGRRQAGARVVSRQGNLTVESTKVVPYAKLREMLVEEAKKQGKEYGLLFEDISGGFTTTRRYGPQAFKVLPIIVYKVYVDGRPDELVRGADIVGTPLTCFSQILCTGDDPAVFNGVCGAESGMVPVSAISPSILVQQIEIEKKQKAQDRPPILPAPIAAEVKP